LVTCGPEYLQTKSILELTVQSFCKALKTNIPVGIISDAAVVALEMMFIVWAMKQERLMQENSLDAPAQWLQ